MLQLVQRHEKCVIVELNFTIMFLKRLAFLLTIAFVLFAGCKKENNNSGLTDTSPDDCVQKATTSNGDIVEGSYIVAYKATSVSTRGISAQRLNNIGEELLLRNSIGKSALRKSFAGEPGGFIAHLSKEEAKRLSQDENIAAIEPDRIISLGTCFTVAAPRLITWNINRVGYGDGIGKRAWIIDSGIDFDHPDLTVDAKLIKSFIIGQSSAED